jgi:hypothetical protein
MNTIRKFKEFINEREVFAFFDEYIAINESRKEAKRIAEIAKKEVKKWKDNTFAARDEYIKSIKNTELMSTNYRKYLDEVNNKMKKFNETFNEQDSFSFIIYLIASIKEFQTNLFKYGITIVKQDAKNNKEIISQKKNNVDDKQIYMALYKNQKTLKEYIQALVESMSKNIEDACKSVNDRLDDIEENSDISSIVFGDAKIKNKDRHRSAKEFKTVYHSDIADFVKDYKLVGIEYDKRIKLVDKQEIFNRFFNKMIKTIEESTKEE